MTKPAREMLPAMAARPDGNQPFQGIPCNREVLQAFSTLRNRLTVEGKLYHAPSISAKDRYEGANYLVPREQLSHILDIRRQDGTHAQWLSHINKTDLP